jgi:signal transduction histidine kinase
MEELLQILVQFGGGKGGEPNNVAVRFLLPTFFWCILACISLREYRASRDTKDLYVGAASLMGMARELLMFVAEYGGWRGFVPFNFLYNYYPPLEHAITMLSCSFIGYAFLNFHLEWEQFPRRFFKISAVITIILYIAIASTWPGFLRLHPGSSFGLFWGDLAFRSTAVIFMGIVLGAFVHAAGQGGQVSKALLCGFTFLFLDEFLMIFNILSNERHVGTFAPIRHNLHIWSVPFLVGMYWNDLHRRMNDATKALTTLNAELEERIALRTAQLTEANNELESFNYSVSHDLRGPLRHVSGYIALLVDDCSSQLNDTVREYLQRITKANSRMNDLIDAMLHLSRTTRSNTLSVREINLSRMAREIAAELTASAPDRTVNFRIAGDIKVYGDPRLVRQVMENLMENAWKYSAGKETAVIEVGNKTDGREATLFVKDNGAGFDMAFADKLFTPFERLHSEQEFEGIGIGLATVRKIVRRHGGRVWAESSVGEGATFFFTLPEGLASSLAAGV